MVVTLVAMPVNDVLLSVAADALMGESGRVAVALTTLAASELAVCRISPRPFA